MNGSGFSGVSGWRLAQSLAWHLCVLACLGLCCGAHAALHALIHADLHTADGLGTNVTLPHYVRQSQSGWLQVHWSMALPPSVVTQRLPALLFPQPVQGLTVKVGQVIVYSLPVSSADSLHQWYRPVLVPLPHALLQGHAPIQIQVEQTGHLRGWYVAPVLQGELVELQPWHDRFLLLSSTLPTTVNLLSVLVGLFVLAIGWRTRSVTYAYGGLTSLVWGVLFSLALTPELPLQAWFFWRLMLYACTGNLIYVVLRFLSAIFHQKIPGWLHGPVLCVLQLGWVIFAWVGPEAEPWLDVVWTGAAVVCYVTGSLLLVVLGLRQGEYVKVAGLGLHGVFTAILAWHDYALQAGELPPSWLQALPQPGYALLLQPIYLTHLSLPVFVVISLWLLVKDHLRHRREQSQHEQALRAQRDRITRDIHDGVGARLNLMLWRTRTAPLVATQLQDEIERTIEELRFAINPPHAATETLTEALCSLCQRSARWGHPLGIQVQFDEPAELGTLSSEHGLHLYKAAHEGLSNALRHSQASQIRVGLAAADHVVMLVIEDNGIGIPGWPGGETTGNFVRTTAMGLRGMQQRMKSLGGECIIESGAAGTRLSFVLPRVENGLST